MEGIVKRFPGVLALDSVDLQVMPGEIVALLGENGAGKSTLMKILGGVYQPDAGEMRIDGRAVTIRSVSDAIALGIGFIHQELNVLDNLDVGANVFLGREPTWAGPLRLVDRAKIRRDTKQYLERLGLDVSPDRPLSELTIAQQQLVEIAKALSLNARILIMDEPTSSLTLTETERLLEVTRELRADGVSVIYISHRLGEVSAIADRVIGLRDGKNAGSLAREEIDHDRMVRLMVGRDLEYSAGREAREPGPVRLEVRDLRTARYPERPVSFAVARGEILGIAGLVGAGRSDVAQAIFGVDRALGGTILLDGEEVRIDSARDAIGYGIYLVPEDRRKQGLLVDMTICENVTLPALKRYTKMALVDGGAERKAAGEICTKLGVKAPTIDVTAATLSGGNQQKVVLAKWLSLDPRVLVFDEPTRGIDVRAKGEIYQLMRGLADAGVAVIMISSDMEEVLGVSDRIAVMHEGSVTGFVAGAEATEESVMRLAVGAHGSSNGHTKPVANTETRAS
jgi:ribose transport system ATP-binding protein